MSASLPVSDEMDRERWWRDARLKRAGVVDFTGMTSSAPATIRGLGWRISFVLRFRRGPTAGMGSSKPDLQSYRLTTCHPETNRGYIPCSRHPREACSAPTRAKTGCRTEKYRLATFFAVRWALPQMKGNQKCMRSFHAPDSVCVPSAKNLRCGGAIRTALRRRMLEITPRRSATVATRRRSYGSRGGSDTRTGSRWPHEIGEGQEGSGKVKLLPLGQVRSTKWKRPDSIRPYF